MSPAEKTVLAFTLPPLGFFACIALWAIFFEGGRRR